MKERIQNIQKHEEALDRINAFLEKLELVADEWQKIMPEMKSLFEYYNSPQWMSVYDAYNDGVIPQMKCGVLSQDAIFNTLFSMRSVSIQLMKSAIDTIE